jgi:hypothetical protein
MVQRVIGGINEKGERHLEGFVHFVWIDLEDDRRGDLATTGRMRKPVPVVWGSR